MCSRQAVPTFLRWVGQLHMLVTHACHVMGKEKGVYRSLMITCAHVMFVLEVYIRLPVMLDNPMISSVNLRPGFVCFGYAHHGHFMPVNICQNLNLWIVLLFWYYIHLHPQSNCEFCPPGNQNINHFTNIATNTLTLSSTSGNNVPYSFRVSLFCVS